MRLCLRHSIKLQDLYEIAKMAFIDAAKEELNKLGDEMSASRVSAISGVHRRDIARVQRAAETPARTNLIARVMAQWQLDKRYCTKTGKPRRLSCEGRESEFSKLVDTVNGGDLSGYAVLYEMERLGIVQRKKQQVKLLWRDYIVQDDVLNGLEMLVADSNDLYLAVEENLDQSTGTKNLHLKTEFDSINPQAIPKIRKWLLEEGSQFQKRVRTYLGQFDHDLVSQNSKSERFCRVAVGTFSVTEEGEKNE
jgi:hypothetical protein